MKIPSPKYRAANSNIGIRIVEVHPDSKEGQKIRSDLESAKEWIEAAKKRLGVGW